MRAGWPVLAAVLLAGCSVPLGGPGPPAPEGPRPGTPPAGPDWTGEARVFEHGPWRATITPGNVTGAAGDVVAFLLRLEHDGPPLAGARLEGGPWTRLAEAEGRPGRESVNVTEAGGTFHGTVLLGPAEAGLVRLHYRDATAGAEGTEYASFQAPRMGLTAEATLAPVEVRTRRDPSAAPEGFSTRVASGRVFATFADGTRSYDCSQGMAAMGAAVVREDAGARVLVAFVARGASDACWGNPPYAPNSRLELVAGPLAPGSLTVRLHAHSSGQVLTGGWTVHETRVTV